MTKPIAAFSADQLALLLSLVESQKNELMGDIENPNSRLSQSSVSTLETRFWQLAKLEQLLNENP